MPNVINNFKRHLEFLIPEEQLCELNHIMKEFNKSYLPCVNINKKVSMLNQLNILKNNLLIKHKLCQQFIRPDFNDKSIMRKINPRSFNIDSFKYSILISLHYDDISFHPERISKLKLFESKYNFIQTTHNDFEINNPNISLTVFDDNNNIIYLSKNNSTDKAHIVKLNNYRYAAIKPLKNKFIKLDKLLESFSHTELREYILQNILKHK